ncbi:MAG: hypothetical protein AB7G13_03000 [Lautropia sp.]
MHHAMDDGGFDRESNRLLHVLRSGVDQVHVAIDQPGHHGSTVAGDLVHALVARRLGHRPGRHDLAVADLDEGVADRLVRYTIDEPTFGQNQFGRRLPDRTAHG